METPFHLLTPAFPLQQDVDWNRQNEKIFASVGDDKTLMMYSILALTVPLIS